MSLFNETLIQVGNVTNPLVATVTAVQVQWFPILMLFLPLSLGMILTAALIKGLNMRFFMVWLVGMVFQLIGVFLYFILLVR